MTTALPFNEQFDQHAAWRREFAFRLKQLAQWMKAQGLLNAAVEGRMLRLQEQVRSDKVMVAFVAGFSRGKSELINAIFFVGYGRRIMPSSAGAFGFWNNASPQDNPPVAADGRVEVPTWRHALVNIAHPLLKQGLVILGTPELNAIGAEPEPTVRLIPQAHAVVFILTADTGVTQSDLAIWQEHLVTGAGQADGRLVVLNKIDTLWDALSTAEQVQAQIDRQRAGSAEILGLPVSRVLAVSAQKGLVAKITQDEALLQASWLPALEAALGQGLMGQQQKILRTAVAASIQALEREAGRTLAMRRRDQAEQMLELRGLQGKNSAVIQHMRKRVEQEQAEFAGSGAKIHAVRSVHNGLLGDVVHLLSLPTLRTELAVLTTALRQPGIKLRLKKTYGQTFSSLRETLHRVQVLTAEVQTMLESSFRQINAEFGFSLQVVQAPGMAQHAQDLELIEQSHLQYLSLGNAIRLAQADFSDRLVRALSGRLRTVFESALADVELWSQSASAQLDAKMRKRRHGVARRIEAIERIEQAAATLDERIAELEGQNLPLQGLQARLEALTAQLLGREPLPFAQPAPLAGTMFSAGAALVEPA